MQVEELFGDYTREGFEEYIKIKYRENTMGLSFKRWIIYYLNEAISKLYNIRAVESGKALVESNLFKNLFNSKEK